MHIADFETWLGVAKVTKGHLSVEELLRDCWEHAQESMKESGWISPAEVDSIAEASATITRLTAQICELEDIVAEDEYEIEDLKIELNTLKLNK